MDDYYEDSSDEDDMGNDAAGALLSSVASDSQDQMEMEEPEDTLASRSRGYQLEMFEESIKRNIIVAMDTGTGKTRVALLRIRHALENSPPSKIVWFLTPTVFLCEQQYSVIVSHIPGAFAKVITGKSGVDAWSTQRVWDALLLSVRVVVATHQILLDAMNHGFVKIQSISLLVFDEVHGCVKQHAGRRIMQEFYGPALARKEEVPAILGLTASPVLGTQIKGLEELERTMHAVCRTPTRFRQELVVHTKQPQTSRHVCDPSTSCIAAGRNLLALDKVYAEGQIQSLSEYRRRHPDIVISEREYEKTWEFMKAFSRRAVRICIELGTWAAEYYVHKVIQRCIKASAGSVLQDDKRAHTIYVLKKVQSRRPDYPTPDAGNSEDFVSEMQFLGGLSSKVQKLVSILLAYDAKHPTGIVFVKERPMAAVLARVLTLHPLLRERFGAGYVVGMSKVFMDAYQSALVLNPHDGEKPLRQFRARTINLLVATSVIEEGIDVPACNLVVCIDELTSLKAFIQRRGRAREQDSQLHLLMNPENARLLSIEFEALEQEMKQRYEDENRDLAHLNPDSTLGAVSDELIDRLLPPLTVPSTQAQMRARDAKMHLQHFCATMSASKFVDWEPVYVLHEDVNMDMDMNTDMDEALNPFKSIPPVRLRATVQLPITLPPQLRRATGQYAWAHEDDACADAAFAAYKALYEAGLVGKNLLPPKVDVDEMGREIEGRPGVVAVYEAYRPWERIAARWATIDGLATDGGQPSQSGPRARRQMWVYRHSVRLADSAGTEICSVDFLLPCALPLMDKPISVFWSANSDEPWTVAIGPARREEAATASTDHTALLLNGAYGHRWPMEKKHQLVRVAVKDGHCLAAEQTEPRTLLSAIHGNDELLSQLANTTFFVRGPDGYPYEYEGHSMSKPSPDLVRKLDRDFGESPEDVPYVFLRPMAKMVGFLHKTVNLEVSQDGSNGMPPVSRKPYRRTMPAAQCTVDTIPKNLVQMGALIPSLMQVLEVNMVTEELLSSTQLGQLAFKDKSLVTSAISAPSARLQDNYEFLEYVGDAVLKLYASVNCAAQNLYSPEGHLSLLKDRRVTNSYLCRAATDFGLDRFIVRNKWSLKYWRKTCDRIAASLAQTASDDGEGAMQASCPSTENLSEELSTKTLADVIEALVGAALLDGGMPLARQSLDILLPKYTWLPLDVARDILFKEAPSTPPWLVPSALERLIGYKFTKKSLLAEAITHASVSGQREGNCMERLEFMGDAILDYIIVKHLMHLQPRLAHQTMHLIRTVLANAHFLGFAAMEFSIAETISDVVPTGKVTFRERDQALWQFMKHSAAEDMVTIQQSTCERHESLRTAINDALWHGNAYPWALLGELRPEKYMSDIVEALIGAIWVDSGSLEPVEALLATIGVLPYMGRVLDGEVHLMHPKEELGSITGNAKIQYVLTISATEEAAPWTGMKKRKREPAMEDDDVYEFVSSGDEDVGPELLPAGDKAPRIRCRLLINEQCVADVENCRTRENAETQAAEIAVREWKAGRIKASP